MATVNRNKIRGLYSSKFSQILQYMVNYDGLVPLICPMVISAKLIVNRIGGAMSIKGIKRIVYIGLITFFAQYNNLVNAQVSLSCGVKPIAKLGCSIGQCVNGQWQQICGGNTSSLKCGLKPLPKLGCRIGQC